MNAITSSIGRLLGEITHDLRNSLVIEYHRNTSGSDVQRHAVTNDDCVEVIDFVP